MNSAMLTFTALAMEANFISAGFFALHAQCHHRDAH